MKLVLVLILLLSGFLFYIGTLFYNLYHRVQYTFKINKDGHLVINNRNKNLRIKPRKKSIQ